MILAPRRGWEHVVKRSKFTEDQIAFALKQAELGTSDGSSGGALRRASAGASERTTRCGWTRPGPRRKLQQTSHQASNPCARGA